MEISPTQSPRMQIATHTLAVMTFSSPGAAGSGGFAVTAGGLQQTPQNTFGTGFLTRIDTTQSGGARLIYSTYLGGNGANSNNNPNSFGFGDLISGVAVDTSSNAYVTGATTSTGTSFPTVNAFQSTANPTTGTAVRSSRALTRRKRMEPHWYIRRIWKAPA